MRNPTPLLIAAGVIGAVIGLAIGYADFMSNAPARFQTSFMLWLTTPDVGYGYTPLWAILGAAVGAGLAYILTYIFTRSS
jgi:membrane protein DedA with SNARE-associated domain